jgi:hypothetical protein
MLGSGRHSHLVRFFVSLPCAEREFPCWRIPLPPFSLLNTSWSLLKWIGALARSVLAVPSQVSCATALTVFLSFPHSHERGFLLPKNALSRFPRSKLSLVSRRGNSVWSIPLVRSSISWFLALVVELNQYAFSSVYLVFESKPRLLRALRANPQKKDVQREQYPNRPRSRGTIAAGRRPHLVLCSLPPSSI